MCFTMVNEKRKGDWVQTYKRKQFWPLDPRSEDVDIEDIAHSLSLICRFNGHCNVFYSVAQHSVIVSHVVRPSESMVGLLHDGAEAYLGDIVRPVKRFLLGIKEIERELERVIFQHFGITTYDKGEVSRADNLVLFTEMRDMMYEPPAVWRESEKYIPFLLRERIIALEPKESERLFLERYGMLK